MIARTRFLGTLAVAGMFITAPAHAAQLHDAARMGDVEEVERLIEQGADVNAIANNGATALMYASQNGHSEVVGLLLTVGGDVNATDPIGMTALIMASQNGHVEIVSQFRAPDIRQELSRLCRRLCSPQHQPEFGVQGGNVLEVP